MNRWWVILVLAVFSVLAFAALAACSAGDDDDDDDDEECTAEDVAGTYLIQFTVTSDTCDETNVGTELTGALRIDQGTTDGQPDRDVVVYFTPDGTSTEELVVVGTACGLQVIGNLVTEDSFEELDCTVTTQSTYTLLVSEANGTRTVAGSHTETTSATGTGCPAVIDPGTSCTVEESIAPIQS